MADRKAAQEAGGGRITNPGFWVQEKSPRTGGEWKEIYTTNSRADASIYMLKFMWDDAAKTPIEFRVVDERGEEV